MKSTSMTISVGPPIYRYCVAATALQRASVIYAAVPEPEAACKLNQPDCGSCVDFSNVQTAGPATCTVCSSPSRKAAPSVMTSPSGIATFLAFSWLKLRRSRDAHLPVQLWLQNELHCTWHVNWHKPCTVQHISRTSQCDHSVKQHKAMDH